jgi:hypothetical protein
MTDAPKLASSDPDYLKWLLDFPVVLRSILAYSSSAIGELWTARHLSGHGYSVVPTNNNSRQRDLLVQTPSGLQFHIEVKCVRGKGNPFLVNRCPDPQRSAYWVLVHAPRDPTGLPSDSEVTYFVLTCEEAAAIWRDSNKAALADTAYDIKWRYLREHIGRWDKLPEWPKETIE